MTMTSFIAELDRCIAKYDLLCHPYYKAWSAGTLTKDDLRLYAGEYYHHVAALPLYMQAAAENIADKPIKAALLKNKAEEEGLAYSDGRPHAELWLDFAEGMGGKREEIAQSQPGQAQQELVNHFFKTAEEGSVVEALATMYAYESQVPRIAQEKLRGLKEMYAADDKTCNYFSSHAIEDEHHAAVWRDLLQKQISANPQAEKQALQAAETTAAYLWRALDGVESARIMHNQL